MSVNEGAVFFFYEHAGWSYDPKRETSEQGRQRGAGNLALAEQWARDHGITFAWEDDWSVDHEREFDCYADGGPDTCEGCTAYDSDGRSVAGLYCIDDATREYRRVVEAELTSDVMHATMTASPELRALLEYAS